MKNFLRVLILVFFCSTIVSYSVWGQSQIIQESGSYKITVGERPPVDFHQLPADAWEPGIFIVKFNEEQVKSINEATFTKGEEGTLVTGIKDFDVLSKQFKVTSGRSMLSNLYKVPGKHHDYKERHNAWGFHLWFVFNTEFDGELIQLIEAFKGLESIELVEPQLKIRRIEPVDKHPIPKESGQSNPKWTPDDTYYNSQWNLENTGQTVFGMPGTPGSDVNVKPAWDITKGLSDVVVAIFDEGIKYNHVDLAGNIWPGIGPEGTSTIAGDHGTSVAGIISAVSNNNTGIAGIAGGSGVNDGARLMSLDIFKETPIYTNMELYIYAADNGAAISQNSWGYDNPNVYNTDDLYGIDYFNANGGGDVMDGGITFFAAGNDGDDQNWYPGYYSGTVAVAGTDNNDLRVYFSSYGTYVELSAPGLNVLSTGIDNSNDDAYYDNTGTSFSAPQASGVAALMLAMAPGKLTPQQLRDIMKSTADNIDYLNPAVAGQMGAGRLNALAALQGVKDLLDGLENPQALNAIATGPTQINLNWTKNEDNHDVMLVFTTDDNFGTPAKGVVYNPGGAISGGGTVLYRGAATAFSHIALEPNTVYFYRAYSCNTSNHYSSGKKANVKTDQGTSADALFLETFEADSPTRASWTQIQVQGDGSWTFAAGSSGGTIATAYKGSLNARFVSESSSGGGSPVTKLVSPALDISGLTNPVVDFWYGQEKWSTDQNQLKVYYRISGASSWVQIAHYTGNVSTWTNVTLALPNPSTTYQVAFEGINNWGYANVVDEVVIRDAVSAVSATYSAGDISTDFPFNPAGVSSCPGSLTVSIPAGAVIVGTDVEYSMTAANTGWKSEQQSRLICTSTGGKYETNIYSGMGDATGTYNYSRTNLDIANGVTGGGNINFEMHAIRTWSNNINDGCMTTDNKVNNNTWKVTVKYYVPKPSIFYSPFSATTSATGNRSLDDVHISTTHPDGIATGANAPRIYWKVNAGSWQSAAASTVSGNHFDFVIGTTGLNNNDVVQYFVIAQSVSGNIVASPGSGLVATNVKTISTYPANPHSYTVVADPLAGNYDISTSKFNQLSGRNIIFEKVVNKVVKSVWVADETQDSRSEAVGDNTKVDEPALAEPTVETASRAKGTYKMMEIEEVTFVPMENGEVYTGSLFIENADRSKGNRGTYATITAAIAALNSLGVSDAVNFMLEETSYSAGETFPIEINVVSEHKPGATKPVTIKPGTGKTVSVTGSVADGNIFSIINTNFVTIDGSNSGGTDRSLTIQNTNTTSPEVILFGSSGTTPVVGAGVKNCILINGDQTSSAVAVTAADNAAGYFNDITIQNNSISKAFIGVYALAAVTPGNGSGLLIADNDLNSDGTNSIRLIGIYVQGVDGVTVRNNNVSNISNANDETARGIWFASGTINGLMIRNTISNFTKASTGDDASLYGISVTSGVSTTGILVAENTVSSLTNSGAADLTFAAISSWAPNTTVSNNTISGITQLSSNVSFYGIEIFDVSNNTISGNTLSGITTATQGIPRGISIEGDCTSVKVTDNKISNIKNTNTSGYSAVGLVLSSTSTVSDVLVYNNFIWDVAGYGYNSTTTDNGYGIQITDGGGYRLYHNSVHLATNQTLATGIPACLMIASELGAGSLDIRNNIFSMAANTGTNRCAVICNSANTVFSTINYNDYYKSGGHIGSIGGNYQTAIAAWRTGTLQDLNSIDATPGFVSSTDLHISGGFSSPLAGKGAYLSAVTNDIDGDLRSTPPFIGADEYGRSWTGSVSSVWNNSSNWNPTAPTAATEAVRIPAGVTYFPEISGAATCGYLLIDEGAEVEIAPGGSLTVSEKLVNNAGKDKLVIKSSNLGTGSLLHNTPGVEATIERYVPASGYHLVSVPFTQTSNPVSGWFLWSYLYEFDAASQQWSAMGEATGIPLNVNQGYMIYKYPGAKWNADTTYAFRGLLNSGAFYADVAYPNTSGNHNLVPNPYPSAIDWNAGTGWTRTDLAGSYWMWMHSADNYGVWNGSTGTNGVTKDIPVGQAFFVQATNANPVLTMNNNVRLHSSQPFYKEKDELVNLLRLDASFDGYSDELVVLFDDGAEAEYNDQEDATKMYGGTNAPQIYSMSDDEYKLSINMRPLGGKKMEIPVGFELSVEGEVSFGAASIDSFDPQVTIHLWDKLTGTMTDLRSTQDYTFFHHPDNDPLRFALLFNSAVSISDPEMTDVLVYFHERYLHLIIPEQLAGISSVNIFNTNGQLVFTSKVADRKSALAVPSLAEGVYMIQLIGQNDLVVKKALYK